MSWRISSKQGIWTDRQMGEKGGGGSDGIGWSGGTIFDGGGGRPVARMLVA